VAHFLGHLVGLRYADMPLRNCQLSWTEKKSHLDRRSCDKQISSHECYLNVLWLSSFALCPNG